jgi:hypothetical protein
MFQIMKVFLALGFVDASDSCLRDPESSEHKVRSFYGQFMLQIFIQM